MALLTDLQKFTQNLFNQGGQAVQNTVVKPAQQAIYNWALKNPQQTSQIVNAPQQIQQFAKQNIQFNPIQNISAPGVGPFQFKQQPIPQLNLPKFQFQNPVGNFAANLPAMLTEGFVNSVPNYQQGNTELNQMLRGERQITPQSLAASIARTAELPLMGVGGGTEAALIKGGLKQGIFQGVKQGIKSNLPIGVGFGVLSGAESGQDITNPVEYAKNMALNVVMSAGLASLLGIGIGGTTGAIKATKDFKYNNFKNILENPTPLEIKTGKIDKGVVDAVKVLKNDGVHTTLTNAVYDLGIDANNLSAEKTVNVFFNDLMPKLSKLSTPEKASIIDTLLSITAKEPYLPKDIHPALKSTLEYAYTSAGQEGRLGPRAVTETKPVIEQVQPKPVTNVTITKPLIKGGSVVEDIKAGFTSGKNEIKTSTPKTQGFRTQFVDRLSPVYDFLGNNKNLATENNAYRQMRLLKAIGGEAEAYITKYLQPILQANRTVLPDLSVLLTLQREGELVGTRGFIRARNSSQINKGISELQAKYGPEGFAKLQEAASQLRQITDDLLVRLHDSGIISDEAFNAIRKENKFYTPMDAIEHLSDELEKGVTSGSFNVSSQNIIKKIGSYEGATGDPLEGILRRIPKVLALTEKNNALKTLVSLKNDAMFKDLIKELKVVKVPIKAKSKTGKIFTRMQEVTERVPVGMDTINVFENGVNKSYALPSNVAAAIKNLDGQTANALTSIASWQAKILRSGATSLSVAFIPVNAIRDFQDAFTTVLTQKGAIPAVKFVLSYPEAILSAMGKGKLWQEWAANGGLQSTMTEQVLKNAGKTVKELSGQRNYVKTVIHSPVSLIEFANRVAEQSTRLARYKTGTRSLGESAREAAFQSRDISLDFAKAGNSIKTLNQVVPFLNAGFQGTEKIIRLYKDNPVQAMAWSALLFGTPTVVLYQHNSQFKDFQDIPIGERQNNWIIIARDRNAAELANGDKVIGLKIPKGFVARNFSNITEAALDYAKQQDPATFVDSMLNIGETFSPVGLPVGGERLGRTVSNITPPFLKAGIETATGKNLYFGNNIVPQSLATEQYRDTTPSIYRLLGEKTGMSPLLLENAVNTSTGALGGQLATGISSLTDLTNPDKVKKDLYDATVGSVTKRFSGIRSGKQADIAYDTVAKEKQFTALRNKQLKDAWAKGNNDGFMKLTEGMTSAQIKSILSNAEDQASNSQLAPEQRAYQSLTKEEQRRLGEKRPDLQSKMDLMPQAGAAETKTTTGTTFKDSLAHDLEVANNKTKVELTGEPILTADTYYYLNDQGNPAVVPLDRELKTPIISGNTELDKQRVSDYKSSITSKINDIVTLNEKGVKGFSDSEAEKKITDLISLKNAGGTGTKSKGKISIAKISTPKVKAIKISTPKMPKLKIAKTPTFKISKSAQPKAYKPKKFKIKFSKKQSLTTS